MPKKFFKMKSLVTCLFLLVSLSLTAQLDKIKLKNAVVVGQLDKPEERYALEGALANLLSDNGVPATPSLNYVKAGGDSRELANDSLKNILMQKGFDTYVIVSVRGYDRKFKPSERRDSLEEKLGQGSLHEIYRQDAVSVTFEFTFYRNGEYLACDVVKCGNISDRESVLKRFRKKVSKRIYKKWK